MVSFFRKKKSTAAAAAQETTRKAPSAEAEQSPAADSVESDNTATTSSSNNSSKNNISSPSSSIALRKSNSWLTIGGGSRSKTTTTTTTPAGSSASTAAASPPPSPSKSPPSRPPPSKTESAATTTTTATAKASLNNNRARRRKKAPGSVGSGSSTGGVSLWSRSSNSRSSVVGVSKLATVQEEVEGGTTTTPSTSNATPAGVAGDGAGYGGGTPETLDTTVTSTNDDDDDDDTEDWLNSIALEPVVDASSFDESDGQVEILTLATKQQRDVFLRNESIKKQLFQEQQQLEQELQLQQLQQLQQQQQPHLQQPHEHAVKSVPMMMMMMPYSSPSSSDAADCISKRSVSPLTISTGEKLLAASSSYANNKLVVAEKNATLLSNAAGRDSSNNNNNNTPNVGEKENSDINNGRARSSSAGDYDPCPTTITAASDAILQPFATRLGGVVLAEQNGKAAAAAAGGVQHDNVGDAQQDGLDETIEDQSTIPTFDSASQDHNMHHTNIMESSSSLASHSYAMRAASGIGMGTAAADVAALGSSAGRNHHYDTSGAVVQDHQQHVSSHKDRLQAVAEKFSSAFNCTYAPQDIMERPLGVMSMFYDKLCLSAHDRQKLYGKGQDEKDHQVNEWSTARKNKPFFSEEFAVMFINRMVSEGISLLYLQSPGTAGNEGSLEWKGKSVTMMIAPGSTGEAEMIQPKLEWTTMPGGLSQYMVTTSLPLLNIHSIITHAHNNDTLGDEMELDDDMCFFTITSRQGAVHVFEANTPDQRDAIVDGLQNAIARLAFHLVTGDSTASAELYNDDRPMLHQQQQQEDAGELPALPNPRLNMNRIAHMMLDY